MRSLLDTLRRRSRRFAGFTLVELMVAVTGGLFVSMAVFMLAKQSSGLYQSEARMSNATVGSVIGYERLRLDLERAGFLASPNLRRDPKLCGVPDGTWPAFLANMQSVFIQKTAAASFPTSVLADNGIAPDEITLAGSYASVEQFPTQSIQLVGSNVVVALQALSPAMVRLGYQNLTGDSAGQAALLGSVFGKGRALRIVDDEGHEQYGTIDSVAGGDPPTVTLATSPTILFRGTSGSTRCGVMGNGAVGHYVNVVNFVHYSLRNMSGNAAYAPLYATQYAGAATGSPADPGRTELVREEWDTDGNAIAGTQEVVTEFAVDLAFGLTISQLVTPSGSSAQVEQLSVIPPGSSGVQDWAGTPAQIGTSRGPQRIRGVRARLSVRSVEADRRSGLQGGGDGGASAPFGGGLYRIGIGPSGGAPFARVRTMQAEIALRNLRGINWP